ncbi:MAG: QueT transporter family protein, partial [Firmicutes bacterium]|nr:QueT transporter family protein [Bacillota bacterium]
IFQPISYGPIQFRIAEALTIMPLFTPAAIPGLFVGCILANIIGQGVIMDVIFGSLATLIGAVLGYLLRRNRWLVPIPAVVANALIIPFVLRYGYGITDIPIALEMVYILAGEVVGCYILGEVLATILMPHKNRLFKDDAL